jgi:hypothetical protein
MARETRITQTRIHYPESPIWDTCITAIEAFYLGERAEGSLIHALIEYSELTRGWECRACLIIPGGDECDPHYSTAEIKLLDTNCRMWLDQEEDVKEGEGCSIERATESDYIHNQDE